MRITITSIGKWKKGPEKNLFDHYCQRIRWPLDLIEIDERQVNATKNLKKDALLEFYDIKNDSARHHIILDEQGILLKSGDLAKKIEHWQNSSIKQLKFFIGGSDGHNPILYDHADLLLSLGPMTWPHLLTRGLLVEQLYRSQQIIANHPYHRY
ncbi:MAG: 23S rRNA (pseudouridine(1915)-N(3))-methyltransferase RlmH [Alphaproteobacteria bacterium]|nr:23S rRNA (pseudouridine(1915)-N(3))-methyltransferase RlmH [Alphaproteobacteria bacterium]